MSPRGWRLLAEWGAETDSIDSSQRQLALRIARAIDRGSNINALDAERAVEILDQASARGFSIEG